MSETMTREPKFGCRWQVIREHQEHDPPIMCEDDDGPFVLHEHFAVIQGQLADSQVVQVRLAKEYQERHAALRLEIERLTAANTRVGHRLVEAEQRTAELEQSLRLHLAVSPDDPILLTPVEQQVVAMRQERDEARSMRDFAKEDRDLYYQRWEAVSKERDFYKTQSEGYYSEAAKACEQRNQAAQREARLRTALEDLVNNIAGLSAYDRIDAINDEVFEQAHQALSQLPTASSQPDGSDQHNPAS